MLTRPSPAMPAMPFPKRDAPPLARVTQPLDPAHIADPRGDVCEKLLAAGLREKVKPGARIAVTAGSRDMAGFVELLKGIVDAIRACGGDPMLLPAMGSHGGATAEGQTRLLHALGVKEETIGAPIHATMETRDLGVCKNGAHAHLDDIAAEADGVIVLGRTLTHPERSEGLASGLLKMITIGLGKQAGAQSAHSHGLWDSIDAVPRFTFAHAKILFGVSLVENGYRQPAVVEVVLPTYDAFREADERLLKVCKTKLGRLPFKTLDVLVVDELGKTISGTGMDTNIVGHWRSSGKGPQTPDFRRIVVLSLTPGSVGNGLGIGLADFTTQRFADAYDPVPTYINLLTATEPGAANTLEAGLPLALPSDREALEVALYSSLGPPEPRICRIKNTAELGTLYLSSALLPEAEKAGFKVEGPLEPLPFGADGNLF